MELTFRFDILGSIPFAINADTYLNDMRQQKNIACAVAAALSIVIVISTATVVCIVLFSYPNNKAPSIVMVSVTQLMVHYGLVSYPMQQ